MRKCKNCDEPAYKTSSYCKTHHSEYYRNLRSKRRELNNEKLCPACRSYQVFDGNVCNACVASAKSRQEIAAERTAAARAKRLENAQYREPDEFKVCIYCKETKDAEKDFYTYRLLDKDDPEDEDKTRYKYSSGCKACERLRSAQQPRKEYDPSIVHPWHVTQINPRVFALSSQGLKRDALLQRLKRKGASIPKKSEDYLLYFYEPCFSPIPCIKAASIDGCLKHFKNFILSPIKRSNP